MVKETKQNEFLTMTKQQKPMYHGKKKKDV